MEEKEMQKILNAVSKKKKFSKRIVSMVIFLNIVFTAAVLYAFLKTSNEPTALIAAWFAFTTGELWMLSSIEKNKINKDGI